MTKTIGFLLIAILTTGCTKTPAQIEKTEPVVNVAVSTLSPEKILNEQLYGRIESLERDLRILEDYLGKDSKFLLAMLDRELDAVELGRDARGSFTDYFIPTANSASKVGATKKEIKVRIDRVIALAEKGKFISSFEEQLMNEGGVAAIKAYADESLK